MVRLLRIEYSGAVYRITHYGNISHTNKVEVFRTMFKSGLTGKEQSRAEWNLIRKALAICRSEKPDHSEVVEFLNNYGAHISRENVVLGNVTTLGDQAVSSVFVTNFSAKRFLVGLEFLWHILAMVQEEYIRHLEDLGGASQDRHRAVDELGKRFLRDVRPRLQAKMKDE